MRHRTDPSASDAEAPSESTLSGPVSGESRSGPLPGDSRLDQALPAGDGADPSARRSGRVRVGVGAVVILLIGAAVVAVLLSAAAQQGDSIPLGTAPTGAASAPFGSPAPTTAPSHGTVLVHVAGAVRNPGIASLANGSRVVDAVAAAGGLTDDADPSGVNLARPVADGEQLLVPRVGETPQGAPAVGGAPAAGGVAAGTMVNLNTATAADLESLPRIGPALAQRILDWRQSNGRFARATDLLKVSGIGQKLFDGLKDQVVV